MILRLAIAGIGLFGVAHATAADLSPPLLEQPQTRQHYSAVGIASWYGSELHGHATADGEIFDMRAISAAHRTMPLPSYARVTNLANGRSIVVRVNDRGPFVGGRILDVSARVANLLEFNRSGIAKVRIDYVGKAPPAGSDGPTLLASLQTGGRPVAAEPAAAGGSVVQALLASLKTVGLPVVPEPAPPAGSAGQALLVSLKSGDSPVAAEPAPPAGSLGQAPSVRRQAGAHPVTFGPVPSTARSDPNEGVTVAARVVERPPAVEPRSPYGDLISSPFLALAARP